MILQLDIDERGCTTLQGLLRAAAADVHRLHGGAADRIPGETVALRPSEMRALADEIERQSGKKAEDDWL